MQKQKNITSAQVPVAENSWHEICYSTIDGNIVFQIKK